MMAHAYGWGATGPSGPVNADGQNTCQDPLPRPTILQETVLRICTADESASAWNGLGLDESQLCTSSTTSNIYYVNI